MHKYAGFLGDPHNEVIIALVLAALAQTVIIWRLWHRADGLQRRLDAAADAAAGLQRRLEATAEAAAHAAAIELDVDGLAPSEGDGDAEVAPAAAIAATPPAAVPADASPSAVYLLLVEDDVNVAKPYRMLLESRGYIVRHAADGVAGLEAARRERPDLLLLDVMMPRMNGISLLQELRDDADLRTIPAVMLSNYHEPRMVERAMALGALEYLVKAQLQPEKLIVAIPRWLRGERVVDA